MNGLGPVYCPPQTPVFVPEPGAPLAPAGWAAELRVGSFASGRPADEFVHLTADESGVVRSVAVCRPWAAGHLHDLTLFTLFNALFLPGRPDPRTGTYRPDHVLAGADSRDVARYEDALTDANWGDSMWSVDGRATAARVWAFDGLAAGHTPASASPSGATLHVVTRDLELTGVRWRRLGHRHDFGFDPFSVHTLEEVRAAQCLGPPLLSDEALERLRRLES